MAEHLTQPTHNIKIRLAVLADAPIITDFMLKMAKDTENKDLDPETVLRGVSGIFHKPKYGRYLVAVVPNALALDDTLSQSE